MIITKAKKKNERRQSTEIDQNQKPKTKNGHGTAKLS